MLDRIDLFLFNDRMDKQCFKCKETKPISEFYAHPMMGDGHLGKCKTCAKRDVSERTGRLENNPKWLAKERARCREKMRRYRERGLAKFYPGAAARWAAKNRHKRNAQTRAERSVKLGLIPKRDSCESCGAIRKLHMHHPDYSKPLEVVFLCPPCHGKAHWKSGQIIR